MGRRRRVTPECKRQAIELLNAGQRPAAEIARELGIPRNRLSKGQKAMGVHGGAFPGWERQAEPAAEVTRLRRELARVTEEEQDILKSRRVLCEGVHVQDAFMQWVLCVAGSASACPRPEDQQLLRLLRPLPQEMRETYGAVQLWRVARCRGLRCWAASGRPTPQAGAVGSPASPTLPVMAEPHQLAPPAPTVLQQCFVATTLTRTGWVISPWFRHEPAGSMSLSCLISVRGG